MRKRHHGCIAATDLKLESKLLWNTHQNILRGTVRSVKWLEWVAKLVSLVRKGSKSISVSKLGCGRATELKLTWLSIAVGSNGWLKNGPDRIGRTCWTSHASETTIFGDCVTTCVRLSVFDVRSQYFRHYRIGWWSHTCRNKQWKRNKAL